MDLGLVVVVGVVVAVFTSPTGGSPFADYPVFPVVALDGGRGGHGGDSSPGALASSSSRGGGQGQGLGGLGRGAAQAVSSLMPAEAEGFEAAGPASSGSAGTPGPDVEFHFHTRLNPVNPEVVPTSFTSAHVDPTLNLAVILHGFTGSVTSKSVTLIRDALLFKQNITVVAVQWAKLARGPWYDEAAANIMVVAQHLHNLLSSLERGGLDLGRVHIIGFSLGAHVAGMTGALLKGRLGRITGLDPARPGFDNQNSSGRLDPTDAQFVVGLHTGAGFVALSEPVGHADFYPNGGSKQPRCQTEDIPLVCNHFMAYTYFAESIYNPDAFPARRCSSWTVYEDGLCDANDMVTLGYHTSPLTRGLYFLRTNAQEPYGLGLADHRVNLDVGQDASTLNSPTNAPGEVSSSRPHNPNSGHDKDIYSVKDGFSSTETIEVQLFNELDSPPHIRSNSFKLKANFQFIFVVLSTTLFLFV